MKTKHTIVISKHGKQVKKLVHIEPPTTLHFGSMKHTITILDDITNPIENNWDAHTPKT